MAGDNVSVVGVTVCLNTVVGDNGTMLGYFMCPFYNEPNDYTYCCGQSDAQYCCRFADELVFAIILLDRVSQYNNFIRWS